MAGAPVSELVARVIASDEASATLAKVSEQVEATAKRFVASNKRAQEQITAILAKGDPARQARLQADKELEQVQRIAKARPQLAAEAAAAEVTIRKRLADTLAKIDAEGAAKASAGQVSLRAAAKGATETVSKVASLANVAGTALGGMGGAAGQAATAIVGAFGAGGPVAIALAATVATIGLIAVRWNEIQTRLAAARADLEATRAGAAAGGSASAREAEEALAAMSATPGSTSRARAEREIEFARKWESDAAAASARASDASARLREAEARANALATDTRDRPGSMAAISAIGEEVERLTKEASAAKKEAEQLSLAAAEYRRSAGAWENLASAERSRAKAKARAAAGRAAAVEKARAEARDARGAQLVTMADVPGQGAGGEQRAGALTPAEIEARYREQYAAEERARRQAISDQAAAAALEEQQRIIGIMGDVTAYTSAGANAMRAFIDGMQAENPADKVKGILTSVLTVAGAIVGGVVAGPAGIMAGAGLGGALAGAATSFERGGPALAVGRRGLATLPGGNDGIPAVLHPNEFTFSAPAVRAAGGVGALAQQHEALIAGRGGGQRSGGTTINVVALDPQTAVGVIERSVEPAMTTRLAARQGALYRAEVQRAARGPRSGV